jgi:hypothetical protein
MSMENSPLSTIHAIPAKLSSTGIRHRNIDLVARYAVMLPLAGNINVPAGKVSRQYKAKQIQLQIEAKHHDIIKDWCNQLEMLHSSGWNQISEVKDVLYAAYCYPALARSVITKGKRAKPCKLDYVCPSCYARSVQSMYTKVAEVFKQVTRDDSGHRIFGFQRDYLWSDEGKHLTRFRTLLKAETGYRAEFYNRSGAVGGFICHVIEPLPNPEDKDKISTTWRISRRGILLLPDHQEDPDLKSSPNSEEPQTWSLDSYNALDLAKLIGRVLCYPTNMLKTFYAPRIAQYLNSRDSKYKSRSLYGVFRDKQKSKNS